MGTATNENRTGNNGEKKIKKMGGGKGTAVICPPKLSDAGRIRHKKRMKKRGMCEKAIPTWEGKKKKNCKKGRTRLVCHCHGVAAQSGGGIRATGVQY